MQVQRVCHGTVPSLSAVSLRLAYALDSQVRDWQPFCICYRRSDDYLGMLVHGMGSAQLVSLGLCDSRGRIDWERPPLHYERCDSQAVAQIFSRAHECVGFAVPPAAALCQVCMTKCSF